MKIFNALAVATAALLITLPVNAQFTAPTGQFNFPGFPTGIPGGSGSSGTLAAPSAVFVCTTTCTVTPPPPFFGYTFCVLNSDAVNTVITLAALGSSARYENTARTAYGTAGTGTFISGGAIGDKVCLFGLDSTHYLTVSFTGTWVAS